MVPRQFWHVTFYTTDEDGKRHPHRRYVKCPYLTPPKDPDSHGGKAYRRPLVDGDPDWPDTHHAMTARLGALEWDGIITGYSVIPVASERIAAIRDRAVRWREVEAKLLAA